MARLKITVLSDASAPSLVLAVLLAVVLAAGISQEDLRRLRTVIEALVAFVLEHAYPDDELGEIELDARRGRRSGPSRGARLGPTAHESRGRVRPLPEELAALTADARDVQLLNLGRDGKRLTAEVPVHSGSGAHAETHHIDAAPRAAQPGPGAPDLIEVRAGTPFDAEAIAQLLYENYHLSYVHEDFYRPRYLMAVLEMRQLLSTVAVHEGRVVGHHGLMRRSTAVPPRRPALPSSTRPTEGWGSSDACLSTQGISIQGLLEEALFPFEGEPLSVHGAGRY